LHGEYHLIAVQPCFQSSISALAKFESVIIQIVTYQSSGEMTFRNTCLHGWLSASVLAGLLLSSSVVHANIYSFRDENGVVHFSNLPHLDKRYKLVYRIPDSMKARPNAWSPNAPKAVDIAKYIPIIDEAARKHGLEPRLLHAVIRAESGYNHAIDSGNGPALRRQRFIRCDTKYRCRRALSS
jgi:hypothetical protein